MKGIIRQTKYSVMLIAGYLVFARVAFSFQIFRVFTPVSEDEVAEFGFFLWFVYSFIFGVVPAYVITIMIVAGFVLFNFAKSWVEGFEEMIEDELKGATNKEGRSINS